MSIDLRKASQGKRAFFAIGVVACAILAAGAGYRHHVAPSAAPSPAAGAYCDNGLRAARSHKATIAPVSLPSTAGAPRINDRKPPGPAPSGMIWIPGGEFWMGSDDGHMPDSKPWHRVYVDGYWMDRTEVTNQQFVEFVKATGYVTIAERKPRKTSRVRLPRTWSPARSSLPHPVIP